MWTAFEKLGLDVERRWRERYHRTDDFPEVAARALADHALHEAVSHEQLVMGALGRNVWPAQFGSRFGQPPINVFVGPGFYIEALTWIDATTSIHQHNFSGAFAVLAGSSVHSQYGFETERVEGSRFKTGRVRFRRAELLETGDVRPILSGERLIHALFHLDRPSITIVVRTYDDATGPQFEYYPPGIALDPFHDPDPGATQLRLLRGLALLASPLLAPGLAQALEASDALLAFRCLEIAHENLEGERLARVQQAAEKRHGALAAQIAAALGEKRRQKNIVLRRNALLDAEPRFLLALLLNLPDREAILQAMRQHAPGEDPVARIVRTLLAAAEKEQIGLTLTAVSAAVLDGLLRDHSFEQIGEALARSYPRREVERQAAALRSVASELERSVFLAPLFRRQGHDGIR